MIKFDVLYRVSETEWKREPIMALKFDNLGETDAFINGGDRLDLREDKYHLFQFAECFDRGGKPIYQGHLLKDEFGKVFEVIKACGSFVIVVDEKLVVLEDRITRQLEIVGDVIQNLDLILSEDEFSKTVNNK